MEMNPKVAAVAFDILSPDRKKATLRSEPRPTHMFIDCGHILRISAVRECGFYVPGPGFYGSEEMDLCLRLLDRNWEIHFLPGVHIWHDKTTVAWPEKPSVNLANQFFQVEYGLTDRHDLMSVSIACGFEAEGYMNFGWVGIPAVGLLVGFVLGIYELAFFSVGSSLTAIAVGLALLPGFLTIESQLVQYLGGILQLAFAAAIVFHQAKVKRSSHGDQGTAHTERFRDVSATH
jgi:hypothetical protein